MNYLIIIASLKSLFMLVLFLIFVIKFSDEVLALGMSFDFANMFSKVVDSGITHSIHRDIYII